VLRLVALLAAIAAAGCGRPHDLGVTSSSSSSSGAGGATSSTGSGGAGGATSSSSSGSGGAVVDAGPSGPTELTIVNGINDYPAVRLCFLPGDTPWPAATSGLAFAGSEVVALPASAIPADSDVTPWVIAGDLAQTGGKTCAQILALAATDAGAPSVLAQPLAVIPKQIWDSKKSLLMVPHGCVGSHDDPNATLACGAGYTPSTPTAGMTLVAMSRQEDPGHVSLQVVSASPAFPEIDVKLLPNLTDATPVLMVSALTQGAIGPAPPFAAMTLAELGPLDGVQIQTYNPGTTSLSSAEALSDVFAHGGVGQAAVVNGARLVLVAVGSGPGLPAGGFWHKLTYAIVAADPG